MFIVFALLIPALTYFWYKKAFEHPRNYPPGPRNPFPLVGDAYVLGKDFYAGAQSLHKKYGKSVGMWIGKHRAVFISDFDILQDILNQNCTALRQHSLPEIRGMTYSFYKANAIFNSNPSGFDKFIYP